jgi:Uma2 family endonuclease
MAIANPPTVGMSLEEFLRLSEDRKIELINGKVYEKVANLYLHSRLIRRLFLLIYELLQADTKGTVFSEATYILPDYYDWNWVKGSRIPDLMIYKAERIAEYEAKSSDFQRPLDMVPDIVIEVLSKNDKMEELEAKIRQDLQNGVALVWVINAENRCVYEYVANSNQRTTIEMAGVLDGTKLIDGLQLPLTTVFGE